MIFTMEILYIIPDWEIYLLFFIGLILGLVPLLLFVLRCPEAKTFIACQNFGGSIIESSDDSGQVEFKRVRPYGKEGQYISGQDRFGKRTIYVVPRLKDSSFTKRYLIKGIRRMLFDHYAGKTATVNKDALVAIEVAETDSKTDLPPAIKEWAEKQNIETEKVEEIADPTTGEKIKKITQEIVTLFTLDSRKLRQYFSDHYDESQYDVLLEQKMQQGYSKGRGSGGGRIGFGFIIFIGVIVVIGVAILLLMRMGYIH